MLIKNGGDLRKEIELLLAVQEMDVKMIRLSSIKKQRQRDLQKVKDVRDSLERQAKQKESEIEEIDDLVKLYESEISELTAKYKKLEAQQSSIKKVEDFDALTKEMSKVEKEKRNLESQTSNALDQKSEEEDLLDQLKSAIAESRKDNEVVEDEICKHISDINAEGQRLQEERKNRAMLVDSEMLTRYENLIRSKGDAVVVPVENHACGGCNIILTVHQENTAKKELVNTFCENCSRILYYPEIDSSMAESKRRRKT